MCITLEDLQRHCNVIFTPNPFGAHFCIEWQIKIETPQRKINLSTLAQPKNLLFPLKAFKIDRKQIK
jgi:hypothetical protein